MEELLSVMVRVPVECQASNTFRVRKLTLSIVRRVIVTHYTAH